MIYTVIYTGLRAMLRSGGTVVSNLSRWYMLDREEYYCDGVVVIVLILRARTRV